MPQPFLHQTKSLNWYSICQQLFIYGVLMKYVILFFLLLTNIYAQDNCDCIYNAERLIKGAGCVNKSTDYYTFFKQTKGDNVKYKGDFIIIPVFAGDITFYFKNAETLTSVKRTLVAEKSTYGIFKAECEEIEKDYKPLTPEKWTKSNHSYINECGTIAIVKHNYKIKTVETYYLLNPNE